MYIKLIGMFLAVSKGVAETSSSQKETDKVLFIAGLSARGRTEFLQHVSLFPGRKAQPHNRTLAVAVALTLIG